MFSQRVDDKKIKEWVEERQDMLEYVSEHGRTETLQKKAQALLEIAEEVDKSEQ